MGGHGAVPYIDYTVTAIESDLTLRFEFELAPSGCAFGGWLLTLEVHWLRRTRYKPYLFQRKGHYQISV